MIIKVFAVIIYPKAIEDKNDITIDQFFNNIDDAKEYINQQEDYFETLTDDFDMRIKEYDLEV